MSQKVDWVCSRCTMTNPSARTICAACELPRPKVAPNAPAPGYSEANLKFLMEMSFPREKAIEALKEKKDNREAALDWLVTQATSSPPPKPKPASGAASAAPVAAPVAAARGASSASQPKEQGGRKKRGSRVDVSVAASGPSGRGPAPMDIESPQPAPIKIPQPQSSQTPTTPVTPITTPPASAPVHRAELLAKTNSGPGNAPLSASAASSSAAPGLGRPKSKGKIPPEKKAEIRADERRALEEELEAKQRQVKHDEIESMRKIQEELKEKREKEVEEKKLDQVRRAREHEAKVQAERDERRAKRLNDEKQFKDIPSILKYLKSHYDTDRFKGICTLSRKISQNILDHPDEEHYRVIKLTNPKIDKALVRPLGGLLMMKMLGFEEKEEVLSIERKAVDPARLKSAIKLFDKCIAHTTTLVPQLIGEIKDAPIERVYFMIHELETIVSNVLTMPDEHNFRTIDTQADSFKNRLAPFPQSLKLLASFGWEPVNQDGRFLEVKKPDIQKLQAALGELRNESAARGKLTPIAKATLQLLLRDPDAAAHIVEKLRSAIQRILAEPHNMKYHKFRVDKLFKKTGPVEGGYDFIRLFGFQVNIIEQTASLPYPGTDFELLQLRLEDLNRSWDDALIVARERGAEPESVKKMELDF